MKKVLCWVLMVSMLLCMLPQTVFAVDEFDEEGEFSFSSELQHSERGYEKITIRRYSKYRQMLLRNKIYFEIEMTSGSETKTYTTESFSVWVWSMDKATLEMACETDDKLAEAYPDIEQAAINQIVERMISENLDPEQLKEQLFDDVVESWYEAEKESITENVVIESIKTGASYNDILGNLVDKGFDIKENFEKANFEKIDEDAPLEEKIEATTGFAKAIMQWLKEIEEAWELIKTFFGAVNAGAVADIEEIVKAPGDPTKYESEIEKEKIACHDAVYELVFND